MDDQEITSPYRIPGGGPDGTPGSLALDQCKKDRERKRRGYIGSQPKGKMGIPVKIGQTTLIAAPSISGSVRCSNSAYARLLSGNTHMAETSVINEFAEEMGYLFNKHALKNRTADITTLTPSEAYEVQDRFLANRVKEGAKIVGWKVGCTSAAIRHQLGLTQPISGKLLQPDIFHSPAQLPVSSFVNCAVEPELVFRLGADLQDEADDDQIVAAIVGVCAGIELHNYRFWYGTPTLQELIASNGIHAGLVLSHMKPLPPSWDIEAEQVSILVNGDVKTTGKCAETLGNPLLSIRWLAKHAAERGQRLRSGELVIPGSAVELVKVEAGDRIEARFTTVGVCHLSLV